MRQKFVSLFRDEIKECIPRMPTLCDTIGGGVGASCFPSKAFDAVVPKTESAGAVPRDWPDNINRANVAKGHDERVARPRERRKIFGVYDAEFFFGK